MLTLRIKFWKRLGKVAPCRVRESGMVYWLGKVILDEFRLVLL